MIKKCDHLQFLAVIAGIYGFLLLAIIHVNDGLASFFASQAAYSAERKTTPPVSYLLTISYKDGIN